METLRLSLTLPTRSSICSFASLRTPLDHAMFQLSLGKHFGVFVALCFLTAIAASQSVSLLTFCTLQLVTPLIGRL